MNLVKNQDNTYTLSLKAGERDTVAWHESKYGAGGLALAISNWLDSMKTAKKQEERVSIQTKYDALTAEQKAQVDAILATAEV